MNDKHKAMLFLAARALNTPGAANAAGAEDAPDAAEGADAAELREPRELLARLERPAGGDPARNPQEAEQFERLLDELGRRLNSAVPEARNP